MATATANRDYRIGHAHKCNCTKHLALHQESCDHESGQASVSHRIQSAINRSRYVALRPGQPALVGNTSYLRGAKSPGQAEGFSRIFHHEISGAGRIDYQFHNEYRGGAKGDPHPVVRILSIDLSSH